jgi:hypothetical protein
VAVYYGKVRTTEDQLCLVLIFRSTSAGGIGIPGMSFAAVFDLRRDRSKYVSTRFCFVCEEGRVYRTLVECDTGHVPTAGCTGVMRYLMVMDLHLHWGNSSAGFEP